MARFMKTKFSIGDKVYHREDSILHSRLLCYEILDIIAIKPNGNRNGPYYYAKRVSNGKSKFIKVVHIDKLWMLFDGIVKALYGNIKHENK